MKISRIILGTAQFGMHYGIKNYTGRIGVTDAHSLLKKACHHGINTIDTAMSYGQSEKTLGLYGISKLKIITKIPPLPENITNIREWVDNQMQHSLGRLNVPTVYGVLLHRPSDLFGKNAAQLMKSLEELKLKGKTSYIGISIYSPFELDNLFDKYKFDIVQCPLNLIDRRMESSGWIDKLKKNGVMVHARSIFLQGLLLMERKNIPIQFSHWNPIWDRWHYILEKKNYLHFALV